jgi:hypothetical protein
MGLEGRRKDTLADWLIKDDKNIKEVTVIYKGDNLGSSVSDPDPDPPDPDPPDPHVFGPPGSGS